jgi:hypothetical protein
VVDKIKSGLLRGQYTLGVFLYIQGAFDNLSIKSAIIGMKNRGFPPLITSWYGHYLSNRCAEIEVKGTKVERSLSKGVPQGGVISPLCWNITFDNMLKEINDNAVLGVGFADDACILITGKQVGNPTSTTSQLKTRDSKDSARA